MSLMREIESAAWGRVGAGMVRGNGNVGKKHGRVRGLAGIGVAWCA